MRCKEHPSIAISNTLCNPPAPSQTDDGAAKEMHGEENHPEEGLPVQRPKEDAFAWLQVLGAFCLNLNTWGLMNAFGVFQTFYQLDFLRSYSASSIAWIGSTQAFLLFLVSLAAGPIFDRGHLKTLLCVGSVLLVLGTFLTSIASQYWHVSLAQAVMTGLGFGCLYLPAPAVVSQYFHQSIALANGVASTGSAVGGIIFPIVFTQVQLRIGFWWAVRVLGFILLGTSIIAAAVMKPRTPPPPTSRSLIDRSAFWDIPYMLLNLGLFFGFMGLYVVFNYIQLLALSRTDVSPALADYLLVIINASSLPGRLIPSYYADKIGSVNVQTAVALASAVLTFSLLAARTAPAVIAVSVLFGFAAGAFMSLPAAGVVALSADKTKIGTRLGMTLAFVGVGVLISNPVAGAILGSDGNWVGLLAWAGALLAASSVSMAASRVVKVGFGLTRVL